MGIMESQSVRRLAALLLRPNIGHPTRATLLVSDVQPAAAPPDHLPVTRERSDTGVAPLGPVLLEWSGP